MASRNEIEFFGLQKKWAIATISNNTELGLSQLVEHLLYLRGISNNQTAEEYLNTHDSLYLPPSILTDLSEALERIRAARENKEKVCIYGDFDADGITGTALLVKAFTRFGLDTIPYIPNRASEGHGLNFDSIKAISAKQVTLIVTVDCGSNDLQEIKYAKEIGIDTIVTDHHVVGKVRPEAIAILNPKSESHAGVFEQLTGVGMALKLADATLSDEFPNWSEGLLELAAIGTITDMAPLIGDNRYIVDRGIKQLRQTENVGLKHLMVEAKISTPLVNAENIGFAIGPRINSAGRLGDAILAYELLTTSSSSRASELSKILENTNLTRRDLTNSTVNHCVALVQDMKEQPNLLIVGDPTFNIGIVGLAAGRLSEKFGLPSVVFKASGNIVTGSCRTNGSFNWATALDSCSDLLLRYGGHAQAAGFTCMLEKFEELSIRLESIASETAELGVHASKGLIDAEVKPSTVMSEAFNTMKLMAPFGIGNPAPIFLGRRMQINKVQYLGRDAQHFQLKIRDDEAIWDAIAFNQTWVEGTELADFVYTINVDHWKGKPRLRLNVQDYLPIS